MHVTVISPESAIFDGEADAVVAPAYDGSLGVFPRHAPMMTLLGKGTLRLAAGERFAVEGGFVQVVDDKVRVVTEHAAKA